MPELPDDAKMQELKGYADNELGIAALELGNIDLLVEFARIGMGISCVIKNFVTDELENGTLHEI